MTIYDFDAGMTPSVNRYWNDDLEEDFRQFTDGLYLAWIHVIPFQEAPAMLRSLSSEGGDEDYIVLMHAPGDFMVPEWVEQMSHYKQRFCIGEWIAIITSH